MKTPKQLERYFKGAANHWRIAIVFAVEKNEGITVEEIADELDGNFKTISQHTRSLVHAGLLNKKYRGRQVTHSLSPYGKSFFRFMKRTDYLVRVNVLGLSRTQCRRGLFSWLWIDLRVLFFQVWYTIIVFRKLEFRI